MANRQQKKGTLPKTNSSPLKIGRNPKGNDRLIVFQQSIFRCNMLCSSREGGYITCFKKPWWMQPLAQPPASCWSFFSMAINSLASLCNESNFFASSAGPKAQSWIDLDLLSDFSIENSKKKCVVLDIEFTRMTIWILVDSYLLARVYLCIALLIFLSHVFKSCFPKHANPFEPSSVVKTWKFNSSV